MILERILADTRRAVAARRAERPLAELVARLDGAPPPVGFAAALRGKGVPVIAELKRASPSRGALRVDLDPGRLAADYARAGAAAISVLTEEAHFRGSLADLEEAHRVVRGAGLSCPILRKDFAVDPYQLVEARLAGADAVLLIVAVLDDATLAGLYRAARELGLGALVEVHDREELHRALELGPEIVGINNRNLRDFTVDLAVTEALRPLVPAGTPVVSESGVRAPADVRRLAGAGVDAVLVGEALVTAGDPAAALGALVEAGR